MGLEIQSKENNKYIVWIKSALENGISWEKIKFGNNDNIEDLVMFLEEQKNRNFWKIDTEGWCTLVDKYRNFVKTCKTVIISHPDNPSDIVIPEHGIFSAYMDKLRKNKFSDLSLGNIEASTVDILSRLNEKTKQVDPVRGLVMGNVQSGKTANMAALMALAADYGYNMFIVLSGTIENLRIQTEERLIRDLNNSTTKVQFILLKHLSAKRSEVDLSNLYLEENSNKRYLNVCLKNSSRLRDLLNWLNKDQRAKKHLKILVIDDEADQAGINTANLDKKLQTRINNLVTKLVFAGHNKPGGVIVPYKAMNYIAYTATPYANFLNEANDSSLYPKNFIATLNLSSEYFGPQQIFGYDEGEYEGLSIINEIGTDDLEIIKHYLEMPKSLSDAISWFLCTVAVFRYYKINSPATMLIHTSHKQNDHKNMADLIKNFFNIISKDKNYINKIEQIWNDQTQKFSIDKFYEQYSDYGIEKEFINKYPYFHELKEEIERLIKGNLNNILLAEDKSFKFTKSVHLCVDNCANNKNEDDIHLRLAYPKKSDNLNFSSAFIVIGGSTLSRGLTLEGLTTTYFVRNSQQADTLMQMGRWFGYRRGYELLPRLWLSNKTTSQFEFLSQLDFDLRNELSSMQMKGKKPSEYGPRINKLPQISFLKVTSKKKMQNSIIVEGGFNDYKGQTTAMYRDDTIIESNFKKTYNFIKNLGKNNQDFKNSFNHNSYVWIDVHYNKIFDFLLSLEYPAINSVHLDMKEISNWYKKSYSHDELDQWNVVVPGLNEAVNKVDFGNIKLNLINRTIFEDSDENIMKFGSITDPKAKKMDVDESKIINFNSKDSYKIHRLKAGYDKTPVLVIYVIDKNSSVKHSFKNSSRKSRIDLNVKQHIIGYDIYIPYGDEAKQKIESKITVRLDFDINGGDIDEM
ncbi:Z1 domain-containing protein [Mycoplasmatota bacterium]|nr:Z1 domain-containing protein [Mycoplasmatota bacterium]